MAPETTSAETPTPEPVAEVPRIAPLASGAAADPAQTARPASVPAFHQAGRGAGTPVGTAQELFKLVEKSNLLSPEQLQRALAIVDLLHRAAKHPRGLGVIAENDPRLLATQLSRQGLLTVWQARQLLAGRSAFFLGKYKLLEVLGSGRRGKLYKAEHVAMRRVVAVKVMRKDLLADPEALARFQREVQTTAVLSHPNVVATYDGDCIDKTHFLVMEFVPGRHLGEWLKQYGFLPIDWSCECIRQTCLGLEHARQQGVVHRDIKPSNLLVIDDQTGGPPLLKILDLGLARLTSTRGKSLVPLTRTGDMLGTVDYMAPEQARDPRRADSRSDIYSAGCTLFELLTGTLPFTGEKRIDRLKARFKNPAPRVGSMRLDVPAELDLVVARMIAKRTDDRYQTPAEVAEALAPFAFRKQGEWDEASSVTLPSAPAQLGRLEPEINADRGLVQFLSGLSTQAEPVSRKDRVLRGR